MAKWKIQVSETVSFSHDIELETNLSEGELDSVLDDVQSKSERLDDVIDNLEKEGIDVTDLTRDSDGYGIDLDIPEMEEVE